MPHDRDAPEDTRWMRRALALAGRALGRTAPNPVVGAVLVKDGRVVGEGWHARAGAPHAEAVALEAAGGEARGATLYVTLEPCAHRGRTPPCAPAVFEAGVARVVAALEDPDERVRGRGFELLRGAGVAVERDVLAGEAAALNEAYLHRVRTGRAYAVMKAAVTLDGRLGADGGESRWITGEAARRRAHELRDRHDAVLVGRGTLERDDPSLDVRLASGGRDPVAVVVDSRLSAPPGRRLWRRAAEGARVVVACAADAPSERQAALEETGVEVLRVAPDGDGRVELGALLGALPARGIDSVLVEGGERVHTAALAAGLYGRAYVFVAPLVLGGADGPRLVGDLGVRAPAGAWRLETPSHECLGPDVLVTGRLVRAEGD